MLACRDTASAGYDQYKPLVLVFVLGVEIVLVTALFL